MDNYASTETIAEKWGLTKGRVASLCADGIIAGAKKEKGRWLIPEEATKPRDKRRTACLSGKASQFTFIDLFAGIGGFHQAMKSLGGKCVMAAEIDSDCRDTYIRNYRIEGGRLWGDVNSIDPNDIPKFDILCAGFPCQPFSKAGFQKGFEDEGRGNLFFSIMNILDVHKEVKFVILENVRNLADKSQNWDVITSELQKRNFYITDEPLILSPTDFGIPQIRERVYILGINKSIKDSNILTNGSIHLNDLNLDKYYKTCRFDEALRILDDGVNESYCIDEDQEEIIFAWEEFRKGIGIKTVGFPIWISAFGYGISDEDDYKHIVGYNQSPRWKQLFLRRNRDLYLNNKEFIDKWIVKHNMLDKIKLYQKFEWNCGEDVDDIRHSLLQIRQSGVRAKRPTFYPSLVAMVNTPIVWDKNLNHFRKLTENEAAKLQSFKKGFKFSKHGRVAYRQLGNSVNVKVLKILTKEMFNLAESGWRK